MLAQYMLWSCVHSSVYVCRKLCSVKTAKDVNVILQRMTLSYSEAHFSGLKPF